MRDFNSLDEREVLALAISLEEEDERIYADFADRLKADFPASAAIFEGMGGEESVHRRRLLELFRQKFGDHIPLIRRQDVRGFVQRSPVWLAPTLRVEKIRAQASAMEQETRRFYERAAARTEDVGIRRLLGDLAQEEIGHSDASAGAVRRSSSQRLRSTRVALGPRRQPERPLRDAR